VEPFEGFSVEEVEVGGLDAEELIVPTQLEHLRRESADERHCGLGEQQASGHQK
jgi:hypothetical protein